MMKLDSWQKEVLETSGHMVVVTPRQMGKSTIMGQHAGDFAMKNRNKSIMIISAVERQALLLFEKVLAYIHMKDRNVIKRGKERPTKHELRLKNGSIIRCLPTGLTGYGIRGFTLDRLYVDEAAQVFDDVYAAVTPSLATTGGDIILLSTPMGKKGYFWDAYQNPDFKTIHVDAEEVLREREADMALRMRKFRDGEKKRLTKNQYLQEYEGMFLDEISQYFSDKLIARCCVAKPLPKQENREYFLGSDIAGMGGDETTFEIVDGSKMESIKHVQNIIKTKQRTTTTIDQIIELNRIFDFNKIGIDDGGMGVGVLDQLLIHEETKTKVKGLNNARRVVDRDGAKKKLLKEDMYNYLLMLMERGYITLLDDEEVKASLKSVQFDVETNKISGNYTHIVEGLIRAVYLLKSKNLSISIYYV